MDADTGRAVELDLSDPTAWRLRAFALLYLERWDTALEANATAIKLEPEETTYVNERANIMNQLGRPADALPLIDRALDMDKTHGSDVVFTALTACTSYLLLGQAERAVAMCEKAAAGSSGSPRLQARLIAAYADHGDLGKASAAKVELLRMMPGYTVAQAKAFDQPSHPEYAKLAEKYYYEGLRKAGIPEQ